MKEYKIAKGWAIFVYISAPLLIALFVWMAFIPFTEGSEGMSPQAGWFFIHLSLAMVTVMVWTLLDTIKGRVIIDKDKIYKKSVLGTRELAFCEIRGFTVGQNYIVIEPIEKNRKKIKISVAYGKTEEIIAWLSSGHRDLDELDHQHETQEIIENEQYGDTIAERTLQLEKARRVTKYYNWSGIAVSLWAFFYPYPYEYLLLACMIVPVIAIIIVKAYKGLIRIDGTERSAYPSVGGGFAGGVFGLFWRAMNDYNIFEYTNCWIPAGVIAAVLVAVLIALQKDFNFKKAYHYWFVIGFLLLSFAYGYSTVVTLNCYYDRSISEVYPTTVVDKKISSGKTTSYYLYLAPWGKVAGVEDVDVSKSLYNSVEKNDPVKVVLRKGRFNIPWLWVTK
jgi:hypothetical protein